MVLFICPYYLITVDQFDLTDWPSGGARLPYAFLCGTLNPKPVGTRSRWPAVVVALYQVP
jgi:hypothetical protein